MRKGKLSSKEIWGERPGVRRDCRRSQDVFLRATTSKKEKNPTLIVHLEFNCEFNLQRLCSENFRSVFRFSDLACGLQRFVDINDRMKDERTTWEGFKPYRNSFQYEKIRTKTKYFKATKIFFKNKRNYHFHTRKASNFKVLVRW